MFDIWKVLTLGYLPDIYISIYLFIYIHTQLHTHTYWICVYFV